MTKREVKKADLTELVKAYSESAEVQAEATENGDFKTGNRASDLISAIYSELRHRGPEAQRALLPLLEADSPGVKLWAASHAMDFSPADGEPVLESLVPVGRFLGLSAKTTLEEWRKGRLTFP